MAYATLKHKGQTRADGTDYIVHPIDVYNILKDLYNGDNRENVLCAGLLHDTLEDTNTSILELTTQFNEEVASLVTEVTNATYAIKEFGKTDYLIHKMLNMTDSALAIKLADRLSNVSDTKGFSEEKRQRLYTETTKIILAVSKHPNLKPYHAQLIKQIGDCILAKKTPKN